MNQKKYARACPICGKPFVPCATNLDAFNWRRVACSIECGCEYFRRVLVARGELKVESAEPEPKDEPQEDAAVLSVEGSAEPSGLELLDEPVAKSYTRKSRKKQASEEE